MSGLTPSPATTAVGRGSTAGPAVARAGRLVERTCIGCRTTRPRRELLRLVLPAAGTVVPDPTGKAQGRGAYICRQTGTTCLLQARRRRAIVRAFRTTPDRVDAEALAHAVEAMLVPEVPSSPR